MQYVIIPSSLFLCEDVCQFLLELSPSQVFWTFRVFSGLTFPTFCVLDSPFGSSFVFLELFAGGFFRVPQWIIFPAFLASEAKF